MRLGAKVGHRVPEPQRSAGSYYERRHGKSCPLASSVGSIPWLHDQLGVPIPLHPLVLRSLVRAHTKAIVRALPQAPQRLTVEGAGCLQGGVYRLATPPSVGFVRSMPRFRDGQSELGLLRVGDQWLVLMGRADEATLSFPDALKFLDLDLDLHSHPGTDAEAFVPSDLDLHQLLTDTPSNGHMFISTEPGLMVFGGHNRLTAPPEGSFPRRLFGELFRDYVHRERGLTPEAFERLGGWTVRRNFFEDRYGLQTMGWADEAQVRRWLEL